MNPYPLALLLSGRRVLVVGGGTVASRRIPALLDAGAQVVVVSPEVTPAVLALADAGRVEWHRRLFNESDVDGAWLVQVAVDDPLAAGEVSAAAMARRVFCVRADDRYAATAWTPAVTRHGPVTVAVTAGGDPRRAMAVRDAIRSGLTEGRLDPRGETSSLPGVRAVGPSTSDRALAGPVGERLGSRPVGVVLIGAGPGDPELITVKGWRLLAEADVVLADRLAPGLLLDELRSDAELIDVSKIPYGPARSQEEINRLLIERAKAGFFVVRLKGGDPYVFGRGGEEVLACVAAGVPVHVVPGVSSAHAAPAAAGIPVTHRGVAHEFTVVSGHLPPGAESSLVDWPALARLRGTVCVLMGLANLDAIAAALISGGRPPKTPVAIVQEGTTPAQRSVRADLATVAEAARQADIRPPAIIVIGHVISTADDMRAASAWR
jgi:uroporphyrin-III C-methyltransferase / precorrin-2 dehydrogenase / sirohydrochlorin ferrochelatase